MKRFILAFVLGITCASAGYATEFSDDFESWSGQWGNWTAGTITGTSVLSVSTNAAKTGTKSLYVGRATSGSAYLTKTFLTCQTSFYVSFDLYVPLDFNNTEGQINLLEVDGWGGAEPGAVYFFIIKSGAETVLYGQGDGNWTTYSSTLQLVPGTWYKVLIKMPVPSASCTVNWWIDGANQPSRVDDLSGAIDTNTGEAGWKTIYFGFLGGGNGKNVYLDNFAVSAATFSATVDTTPPNAPATVRDGTGTSDASTGYTLSANWDASTDAESGISKYQYAIGTTAGATDVKAWTDNATTSVIPTGLTATAGTMYYFTVKAVNGAGLESTATNSNGLTIQSDSSAPSAPAAVRDGTGTSDGASTTSTTQLAANWDASTDAESGISKYQYAIGTTAGGTDTTSWTDNNTTTVTKTGLTLTVNTTYYFTVKALNGSAIASAVTNSNGQVVLPVPDTTAPVISVVASSNLSMTGARITWTTNEAATSQVEYGLTTNYGTSTTADSTLVASHSVDISGLTANTLYHYRVKSTDGSNNPATGTDNTFTTTNTAAPVLSAVTATAITNGIRITWTTDVSATSQVEYGANTAYGTVTTATSALATSHSVDITGLAAGTYHYRAKSVASSIETASADGTFTISSEIPGTVIKAFPNPCDFSGGSKMTFKISGTAGGTVKVYTMDGVLVRTLAATSGAATAEWDGNNESGQAVKSGVYVFVSEGSTKQKGKVLVVR